MARLTKKKALEQAQSQEKVYRTAIYTRLSLVDNNKKDNEDSIENQVNIVKDFMKDKEEFKLKKIYQDNGYKGTTFDRPAFKEMLEDIQKNKIDCVIVKDLSRLGRDYIQTGEYIQEIFPFHNVRFIAINNDVDTDNLNSLSNIILNFTNFSNNSYALDISKKSSQAVKMLREKGSYTGTYPPYGYKKIRDEKTKIISFIIDEEVVNNVKLIFKLKLDGYSYSKIAKHLNELDILSPYEHLSSQGILKSRKNKIYWHHNVIKGILKNEAYVGNMVQGKVKTSLLDGYKNKKLSQDDWVRVENTHQPIISKDEFCQVQEMLNQINIEYNSQKDYKDYKIEDIFKGKIKCNCGGTYYLTTAVNKYKDQSTYIGHSYRCTTIKRSKKQVNCSVGGISSKYLNEVIFKSIRQQIDNFTDLDSIMKDKEYTNEFQVKFDTLSKRIEKTKKELDKIIKIKESLYDDFTEKLLNENEYILAKKKYQDKEIELKSILIESVKEQTLLDGQKSANAKYLKSLMSFKNEKCLTKEIVDLLIDEIKIHSREDIEIIYKFKLDTSIVKGGN